MRKYDETCYCMRDKSPTQKAIKRFNIYVGEWIAVLAPWIGAALFILFIYVALHVDCRHKN